MVNIKWRIDNLIPVSLTFGMPHESVLTRRTRELLKHRDRTITMRKIAVETNLSIRFLESFAYQHSEDYGTNRVTVLYEYLSGRKLEVA